MSFEQKQTSGTAHHDDEASSYYSAALTAYDSGDYAESLRLFKTAADKGEATAAWNLYVMYLNGDGVEKDETESFRWLLRSAELGSIDAMFMAATWYCNGSDYLEEDDEQALFWAKKAKESDELDDDFDAQIDDLIRQIESNIAFNAATAAQDAGNYAEAVRQYEIASDKGDAYAMYFLAEGYYKGTLGAEKDYKQALFWAQKAKDSRDLDDGSAAKVDDMIRSIERHMAFSAGLDAKNAGHLSEAIRQYKKAVDLGSASAAWNLFVMFYNGEGVKKNETESFRWLLRSAELGEVYGMHSLAVCYYWGTLGTKKDKERALYWAVKAKESGRLNDDDTAQMEDIIRRIREEV